MNPDGTVGRWTEIHPSKLAGEANHNAMQIQPECDLIFVALHTRDALAIIDPRHPRNAVTEVVSVAAKPRIHEYAALEYSAGRGSLVYYSAVDGAVVYYIDWDSKARWHASSAPTSLDPIADAAARSRHHVNRIHTFGRFRVAHYEGNDLAILVRHVDSPVYAMRLT